MPADKQATYLAAVRDAYPELTVHSAWVVDNEGQHNDILVLNDELIFRFPRTGEGAVTLATEVALLRAIQGRLPLPIPDPVYSRVEESRGVATFMGYRMLPGKPLWRQTLLAIEDDNVLQRLAAPVAEFILALHAIDPADLECRLERRDGLDYWRQMYHHISTVLYDGMTDEAIEKVTGQFERFFKALERFSYTPVLRHGDLGGSNILHDPASHSVTGVIDFGAVAVGDPATDIAALATLGEPFFTHICRLYPVDEGMLQRAAFYRETFGLQQALAAKRTGNPDDMLDGLGVYL